MLWYSLLRDSNGRPMLFFRFFIYRRDLPSMLRPVTLILVALGAQKIDDKSIACMEWIINATKG